MNQTQELQRSHNTHHSRESISCHNVAPKGTSIYIYMYIFAYSTLDYCNHDLSSKNPRVLLLAKPQNYRDLYIGAIVAGI